jgi:hypothetical protein
MDITELQKHEYINFHLMRLSVTVCFSLRLDFKKILRLIV